MTGPGPAMSRPNDPDVGGGLMEAALPYVPFSATLGFGNVDIGYRILSLSPTVGPGQVIAIDVIRLCPFLITRPTFIDKLAFVVTATGGAGSVARCGIYRASSVAPFLPTTLVVDSGQFDTNASANGKITNVSLVLAPGWYWAAYVCGVAAPTIRIQASVSGGHFGLEVVASATTVNVAGGLQLAFPYAALPATLAGNAISAYGLSVALPLILARVNA